MVLCQCIYFFLLQRKLLVFFINQLLATLLDKGDFTLLLSLKQLILRGQLLYLIFIVFPRSLEFAIVLSLDASYSLFVLLLYLSYTREVFIFLILNISFVLCDLNTLRGELILLVEIILLQLFIIVLQLLYPVVLFTNKVSKLLNLCLKSTNLAAGPQDLILIIQLCL